MNKTITPDEKEGITMIQYLQKMANIDESDEEALRGWRGMSESKKETTKHVYQMCKKVAK